MDKAQPVKKVGVPVGTATVGALRTQLKKEKQKLHGALTSRHSNFGGTLVVNRPDGKRQIQSAALVERLGTASASSSQVIQRKNRKTEPFVASNSSLASHTRRAVASTDAMGPAAQEAQRTLHGFCKRFLQKCYGPVMKSLKNEFRRDSARLESDDQATFFRIVWFFSQWWRVSGTGGRRNHLDKSVESEAVEKGRDVSNGELGQLIFTMDIFTFNLVLNATDTFFQHKQHSQLAQAVALYCEMMHLLYRMYQSKETTEQIMALGLMDRLFYASESLDRLPKLLSKWSPSTNTRDYLCDVVELCHVTLKLLESNSKEALDGAQKDSKEKADAVARMKENAADFDVTSYLSRKIISAHVVAAYTYLLSHYSTNAAHVNHHIIAFFLRLSKFKIATNQDDAERDEMGIPKNLLATKTVTLEPMLYNIKLIMVLNTILNDATIRHDPEFGFLLTFAASFMHNFCQSCQSNPLLYVECLFRHVVPHRFCDWSTNHYVSEELRMIAERELLLEETRRFEGQEEPNDDVSNEEGDEDEPELEFLDDENGAIVAAPRQLAIHSPVAESSIKGNNEEDEEPHDGVSNEEGGEDEPELEFFDDENGAIAAAPRQHANHSPVSENSIKSKSNNEENDDLSRSRLLLEGNTICKKRLVNDNLAVENDVLRKPKKLARVIEDSSDDEEPN
jgi:timeless